MSPCVRPLCISILALAAYSNPCIATATESSVITNPATSSVTVTRTETGIVAQTAQGTLTLEPWSARDIRVRFHKDAAWPGTYNPVVIANTPQPKSVKWSISETPAAYQIATDFLQVRIDRNKGTLSFHDQSGNELLNEPGNARVLADKPAATSAVSQQFTIRDGSAIYGLGQHQNGLMDYTGNSVRLQQVNTDVGVPMLLASKGFGILWNNASVTNVDVRLPQNHGMLGIRSEAGGGIDYHFIYGPDADQIIAEYRSLTGDAPMMARWTWGLWQSKERYSSQVEILGIAAKYRELKIPFDAVVQDWQYWAPGDWGSHVMEASRYPDPKAMLATLHAQNVHAIVSVWPRFDTGTANLAELDKAGVIFPPVYPNVYPAGKGKWYDPYGQKGREMYWSQIMKNLGTVGFDGWWLDASEAELGGNWGELRNIQTAAGPGAEVYNAYPLMHTTAVFEGMRKDIPDKRPVILTRSAYLGQQRNAAITWSGDVAGTWDVLRRQIPAALNFSITGIPYWSADIGGFFGAGKLDAAYAELFTRWYQFAAFNPMFRIHGTSAGKEIWKFDSATQKILIDYDKLRYRLIPYIYSTSWDVAHNKSTMMRPLVMDFRTDVQALNIPDQYMFGKALMVAPVTTPKTKARNVYLPGSDPWYDFKTGQRHEAGQTITVAAGIDTIPLLVRAGSILPLGPVIQYADQQSEEATEIRVYAGKNGQFELYDDAGDGYGYQAGQFSLIKFVWNDASHNLSISPRDGQFPGMSKNRTFKISCAGSGAGTKTVQDIKYAGQGVTLALPGCR